MIPKKRKSYTREFKIETVKLVTDGGASANQIAEDMGIHVNTLYKWIRELSAKPEEAFPGKRGPRGTLLIEDQEGRSKRGKGDALKKLNN